MLNGSDGIEVAQPKPGLELQVNNSGHNPETAPEPTHLVHPYNSQQHYLAVTENLDYRGEKGGLGKPQICGLARKRFWIIAAILGSIILAAALGGGLGGGPSQKGGPAISTQTSTTSITSSKTFPLSLAAISSTAAASKVASASASASATFQNIPSSTEVIGPSATLLRGCPASHDTVLPVQSDSELLQFRKVCSATIYNAGGENYVDKDTSSLDECIRECASYNEFIGMANTNPCSAVCWRNGFVNDDKPGRCFGFTTAPFEGKNFLLQFHGYRL